MDDFENLQQGAKDIFNQAQNRATQAVDWTKWKLDQQNRLSKLNADICNLDMNIKTNKAFLANTAYAMYVQSNFKWDELGKTCDKIIQINKERESKVIEKTKVESEQPALSPISSSLPLTSGNTSSTTPVVIPQVNPEISKFLSQAEAALERGERGQAASFVNEALKIDYLYPEAWVLIQKILGDTQNVKDFQLVFTKKYFPDKLALLTAPAQITQQSYNAEQLLSDSQEISPETTRSLDLHQDITISQHEALYGGLKTVASNGERFTVKIPVGIKEGVQIRCKGKGNVGEVAGEKIYGDLYLHVSIVSSEVYKRNHDSEKPQDMEATALSLPRSSVNSPTDSFDSETMLIVKRKKWEGMIVTYEVFVDDRLVGSVNHGDDLRVVLAAGWHEVYVVSRSKKSKIKTVEARGGELILECDRYGDYFFLSKTQYDSVDEEIEDLMSLPIIRTSGSVADQPRANKIVQQSSRALKPLVKYRESRARDSEKQRIADELIWKILGVPLQLLTPKRENVSRNAFLWALAGFAISSAISISSSMGEEAFFVILLGAYIPWSLTWWGSENTLATNWFSLWILTPVMAPFIALEHNANLKRLQKQRIVYEENYRELLYLPDSPPSLKDLPIVKKIYAVPGMSAEMQLLLMFMKFASAAAAVIAFVIWISS